MKSFRPGRRASPTVRRWPSVPKASPGHSSANGSLDVQKRSFQAVISFERGIGHRKGCPALLVMTGIGSQQTFDHESFCADAFSSWSASRSGSWASFRRPLTANASRIAPASRLHFIAFWRRGSGSLIEISVFRRVRRAGYVGNPTEGQELSGWRQVIVAQSENMPSGLRAT